LNRIKNGFMGHVDTNGTDWSVFEKLLYTYVSNECFITVKGTNRKLTADRTSTFRNLIAKIVISCNLK
jgi:hypothetical protein